MLDDSPSGELKQSNVRIGDLSMRVHGHSRNHYVRTQDDKWRFWISYDRYEEVDPDVVFDLGGAKLYAYCTRFGGFDSELDGRISFQMSYSVDVYDELSGTVALDKTEVNEA